MLQLIADGLVIGSIISLGAIGLTMTYSLLRFANFGQGELMTWGAYLALTFVGVFVAVSGGGVMQPLGPFSFGWQLLAALAVAAVLTAGIALVVDWLLFARLRRQGTAIVLVIASFGAALALRNLLQFIYGPIPEYYTRELQIAVRLLPRDVMGGVRVTPDQMLVLGLTLALVVALHLFLKYTTLGRAMRATSTNPALARVTGIDVAGVVRATWIIGAMLAAMGGLIVGLAESLSTPLIGAEYRAATAFLVLIAILFLRPTGLFGEKA
jgi:branched-chain amino acid transport system permease protein